MFTIRFATVDYRPDLGITVRNDVDGWGEDLPGVYENDEWRFELPEQRCARPGASVSSVKSFDRLPKGAPLRIVVVVLIHTC